MKVFKTQEFWRWLYSSGQTGLSEEIFRSLKKEFSYQNKEIVSEFNGEKNKWNFETVRIDLPITNEYHICNLLQLQEDGTFDENLYIKQNNEYYVLGWIDCHNHEMVFRIEEFYELMNYFKYSLPNRELSSVYFLFLSRFVALTNDESAKRLIKETSMHYKNLLDNDENMEHKITKLTSYGNKIYGTDLVMKIKVISSNNSPIRFTINEGISWKKANDGTYKLEGFGAHSLRNKLYDKGYRRPIDLYDVNTSLDDYSFPYQIWKAMLQKIN